MAFKIDSYWRWISLVNSRFDWIVTHKSEELELGNFILVLPFHQITKTIDGSNLIEEHNTLCAFDRYLRSSRMYSHSHAIVAMNLTQRIYKEVSKCFQFFPFVFCLCNVQCFGWFTYTLCSLWCGTNRVSLALNKLQSQYNTIISISR